MTSTTLPDPDGGGGLSAPVTTYGYDILGRRTSLTDPTGNVTSWAYDGLSRVTSETNELSEVRTFEYNAASQLTKRTDRRGLAREFSYDPLGRMTAEVWKNGGSTVRTISFAYNAGSALTSASDADSSYAYTYDNLGRVTNVDNNGTSGVPRVQLASAYDANSNRTSVSATITSTLDLLNSYTYDGLNRLTRLDQTGQTGGNSVAEKRVDFAYNARSQFSSLARYKDTDGGSTHEVATSAFAYDNLGRLTSLDHKHSTTDLANYDWTYDAASRVTQFAYSHLVGGSGTSDYSYDHTDQVTAANHSALTDEAYSFDASGNRTNSGYTTGDDNQLSSDGTFNYTYDDEGNRLTRTRISSSPATDKTVEYTWDHRNRLTKVKNKDQTNATTQVVEYIYDLYDRKIGRKVDSDGDADWDSVERYLYDGDDVVLEFLDADGDGAGSQALSKRYLWGPAVDQLLAQEDVLKSFSADDRVLWPLTDNLGSVRDLVDQTGDVVNHIEYDSFGKPARVLDGSGSSVALSTLPTRYLYTTREYDSLTDLQYNRARWYDPRTGKWLSMDPIGFAAGDTNLTRYVGNNATNATDPSGLEPPAQSNGSFLGGVVVEGLKDGAGLMFWPYGIYRGHQRIKGVVDDTLTVWQNTDGTGASTAERVYVAGGTTLGTIVGVRGLSDAFSDHDAVDGHRQCGAEQFFDGVTGSIQLAGTGYGLYSGLRGLAGQPAPPKGRLASNIDDAAQPSPPPTPPMEQGRNSLGRFVPKRPGELPPGSLAESMTWDSIAQRPGWTVIRGRVTVVDALGRRRVYDGVAISPNGHVIGLEIKSGSARLTAAQRLFDSCLNSSRDNFAFGTGRNAGLVVERAVEIRK